MPTEAVLNNNQQKMAFSGALSSRIALTSHCLSHIANLTGKGR